MFLRMLQSKRKENDVGHAMQSSNLLSGNWETVDAVSIVISLIKEQVIFPVRYLYRLPKLCCPPPVGGTIEQPLQHQSFSVYITPPPPEKICLMGTCEGHHFRAITDTSSDHVVIVTERYFGSVQQFLIIKHEGPT